MATGTDEATGLGLPTHNNLPQSRRGKSRGNPQGNEGGSRVISSLQGGGPSPYENTPGQAGGSF